VEQLSLLAIIALFSTFTVQGHHHHVRLFEVVKRNRPHTVQKIDVGIYMGIHTHTYRLNTFICTVHSF